MPFHRAACLALRLGCALLAARTLAGEEDGARFAGLARRYGALLRDQIRHPRRTW